MNKESHIQWIYYNMNNSDYYVSLERETLQHIKEWKTVKSKIVYYHSRDFDQIEKMVQKKLLMILLIDKNHSKYRKEVKIIDTGDEIWFKISEWLLNALIEWELGEYQHRYDTINKMHFLVGEPENSFCEKDWFDFIFGFCESLNKKQPTEWDLFESDYINVYKSS